VARVVIVSDLRSKGSAKSGKIGNLAQDSYLEHDWYLDSRSKSVELELSRLTVL
jgi:hypothetical protein